MKKEYVLIQESYTVEQVGNIIKTVVSDVMSREYDEYGYQIV